MDEPVQGSTTSTFAKLAGALSKAQGEFPVIPKDSEVVVYSKDTPKRELYRYKYADLTTIISSTRPALSKHGLSFTQGMIAGGFITKFMHESGEQLESGFIPCDVPKTTDMKAVAGMITYIKRISLTAALGVSADEDVDAGAIEGTLGNSTTKGKPGHTPPPADKTNAQSKPPAEKKVNNNAPADQVTMDRLLDLMIDRGLHENEVNNLIVNGYGFKNGRPPMWVAIEVGKLLELEDTDSNTIKKKFDEVKKRREQAGKK